MLGGIEQLPFEVRTPRAVGRGLARLAFWVWTLGLILLAILLLLLLGFGNVIGMMEARPGMSALLGFALLVFADFGDHAHRCSAEPIGHGRLFPASTGGLSGGSRGNGRSALEAAAARDGRNRWLAHCCRNLWNFHNCAAGANPCVGWPDRLCRTMGIGAVVLEMTRALRPASH
ncbi:MAG: hypothetical protein DMG30_11670 [Acidobacteria bacterium]|nr:MAG: hypothetical protein DMG30_11670 [Acidobacteriota bacterium]